MTDTTYIDRRDESRMDAAREAAADMLAPSLSRQHGLKVGRAIEIALASLEADLITLDPLEKLLVAEGITEACWGALEEELGGAEIDFDEAERGMCKSSNRYGEARALEARGSV